MDVEKLLRIYEVVRVLGGRGNSRRIAELLGISERTVQRYLRILIDGEYVEPVRHGMKLYYRVVKPLTEGEARELIKGEVRREATVYELGRRIYDIIKEGGFRADLVGAVKIHLLVPTHSRITHDVNVVVIKDHARMLVTLLKYGLGLIVEKVDDTSTDYRLRHLVENIKVEVMVDGFKEEGRLVWNLAPILRSGSLSLEHVVIAKLARRHFDLRTDAYDVAISLPHIDTDRFTGIFEELKRDSPLLAERIPKHLNTVEDYIIREYVGVVILLHRRRQF
jgi:predicted transcriptional regulator